MTMKYIAVRDTGKDSIEFAFAGARRASNLISGYEIDWDRNATAQLSMGTLYEFDEVDEKIAVEEVSKWHPGAEIVVLSVDKLFQRMPGPLTEKKLTKEGKLPI